MSVGRDPVDRIVDVLVAAPICTFLVARGAIPVVARAGGRRAMSLIERAVRLDQVQVPPMTTSARPTESRGEPSPQVDEESKLPIEGYDLLAARQVCDRLDSLTDAELALVARHERAHRGRRTVLSKIEQLTT
jgi:hypothetical protein